MQYSYTDLHSASLAPIKHESIVAPPKSTLPSDAKIITYKQLFHNICKSLPKLNQVRKRNQNPNFLVRIFSSGVQVFHVKGWGPKSSVCPSKTGKSNVLGGISRDFAGISRGARKIC